MSKTKKIIISFILLHPLLLSLAYLRASIKHIKNLPECQEIASQLDILENWIYLICYYIDKIIVLFYETMYGLISTFPILCTILMILGLIIYLIQDAYKFNERFQDRVSTNLHEFK